MTDERGQLGVALLCPAAGALLSMQVAGRIAGRYGSAVLVRVAPLGAAAATALAGASHSLPAFIAALLAFGIADGLTDVSMNAHAVAAETVLGGGRGPAPAGTTGIRIRSMLLPQSFSSTNPRDCPT
jgi:MFS family permease